jgi:hypothetical protein
VSSYQGPGTLRSAQIGPSKSLWTRSQQLNRRHRNSWRPHLHSGMSTKSTKREITRSRTGCWTCRTRRKKCDETRPVCRTCAGLDLVCEGYGVRLKWAVHRKSRVTFKNQASRGSSVRTTQSPKDSTGLSPESVSNSPEETNARDQLLLQHLGQPTFNTLSKLERRALYDCLLALGLHHDFQLTKAQSLTGELQRSARRMLSALTTLRRTSMGAPNPGQCY